MSILDEYVSPEPDWRERAICARPDAAEFLPRPVKRALADVAPDDWFPYLTGHPRDENRGQAQRLREICGWCPVSEACLSTALKEESSLPHEHRWGVRGGHTPRERAAMDPGRRPVGNQLDVDTCPEPGKTRGLERHARIGQDPCLACKTYGQRGEGRRGRDELVLRLAADGATAWRISLMTGESYGTVRGVLARNGVEPARVTIAEGNPA